METKKIEIPFSVSDLEDLLNGETFTWAFNTNDGQEIEVYLFNEEI